MKSMNLLNWYYSWKNENHHYAINLLLLACNIILSLNNYITKKKCFPNSSPTAYFVLLFARLYLKILQSRTTLLSLVFFFYFIYHYTEANQLFFSSICCSSSQFFILFNYLYNIFYFSLLLLELIFYWLLLLLLTLLSPWFFALFWMSFHSFLSVFRFHTRISWLELSIDCTLYVSST